MGRRYGLRLFSAGGIERKPENNIYSDLRFHTHTNCLQCFSRGPHTHLCINGCQEEDGTLCRYTQLVYNNMSLDARSIAQYCQNADNDDDDNEAAPMIRNVPATQWMRKENGPRQREVWDDDCPHLIQYKALMRALFDVDLDNPSDDDFVDPSVYDPDTW